MNSKKWYIKVDKHNCKIIGSWFNIHSTNNIKTGYDNIIYYRPFAYLIYPSIGITHHFLQISPKYHNEYKEISMEYWNKFIYKSYIKRLK